MEDLDFLLLLGNFLLYSIPNQNSTCFLVNYLDYNYGQYKSKDFMIVQFLTTLNS